MKNLIYTMALSFLITSCNFNDKKETKIEVEKTNPVKTKTIEYDIIDQISTEGAAASADYVDGKIKKCTTDIYGEMGQIQVIYQFQDNQINVSQENFTYETEGENINREKWTSEKIFYSIDLNGLLIKSNVDQEKISDIFREVKKSVPFELK